MLVAAAALLWLRKRRTVVRDEAEAEPFTAPGQDAKSSAPAVLAPIGNVPRRRVPPRPLAALPLALQFEPQSLRLSFVYATLAYRLELANDGDLPLRDLRVSGDLASGHATVPVVRQLAPGAGELRNMHAVPLVEPGEILVLSGEIQSAIAEILPLRAGPALMFAPLARLRIDMQGANGKPGTETFIFTLGLPSPRQGETMQPFRLDLGPQLFRPIEQRPVDAARWLELDQLRAAG